MPPHFTPPPPPSQFKPLPRLLNGGLWVHFSKHGGGRRDKRREWGEGAWSNADGDNVGGGV